MAAGGSKRGTGECHLRFEGKAPLRIPASASILLVDRLEGAQVCFPRSSSLQLRALGGPSANAAWSVATVRPRDSPPESEVQTPPAPHLPQEFAYPSCQVPEHQHSPPHSQPGKRHCLDTSTVSLCSATQDVGPPRSECCGSSSCSPKSTGSDLNECQVQCSLEYSAGVVPPQEQSFPAVE